jgi:hypothetical protein
VREAKKRENEIIEASNSHFARGKLWLNSVAGGSHLALGTCRCCGWLPMVVGPRRWWLLLADGISPSSLVLSLLVVAPRHRWYLPISWHSWSRRRRHSSGVVIVSPLASPVSAGCFPAFSRNPPGLGWCSPHFSWWSSHLCRNNIKLVKEKNKRENIHMGSRGNTPLAVPP